MRRIVSILTFSALAGLGAPALAQGGPSYDFCVACTAPQAIYLCTVGPRQPDPGARAWGAYCAERARVDAGHGQCSAQALAGDCRATRAFVFRGPSATPNQAEALVSAEPERRASAAAQIWQATVDSVEAVGDTVGTGASAVGQGAVEVGEAVGSGVEQGAGAVGRGAGAVWDGVVRGAGCIVSLGRRC